MKTFFLFAMYYALVAGGATLILSLTFGKKTPKPEVKHGR